MRTARILGTLALVLLLALPAAAQERQRKKGKRPQLSTMSRAMLLVQRLREALDGMDLTAQQQQQVEQVRAELRPQLEEVLEKLRDLLTEEQRQAAEDAVRKAREAGKKGRAFFVAVETAVKLTDEQREKVNKLGQQTLKLSRQMVKKIMGVLTPEQQENLKKKLRPPRKKETKGAAEKKQT